MELGTGMPTPILFHFQGGENLHGVGLEVFSHPEGSSSFNKVVMTIMREREREREKIINSISIKRLNYLCKYFEININ